MNDNIHERAKHDERTTRAERAIVVEGTSLKERRPWLDRYLNRQAMSRKNRRLLQILQTVSTLKSYANHKTV